MTNRPEMVVLSHLRWDFVFQRPQHLLARFARTRRVLFVEEPLHRPGAAPSWELASPTPGVTVARMLTPDPTPGFADTHLPVLRPMLRELLASQGMRDYLAWFYTPQAVPLAAALDPSLVVYDCMDELSAFRNAPAELRAREEQLLRMADLVFTGGRSLYRAKQHRHPSVHCFPSSVDAAHFRTALTTRRDPADQAALPQPRLGFYGVIDERMDLELLAALAEARPDWQIVLVGPVVKIEPAALPAYPNIAYLGQRSYAELPAYLSGWDVALLPFALNESTRFISPTKTLEYMAAERPIVSTPIADVADVYSDVVQIAGTPADFIAACEQTLALTDAERASLSARMRTTLGSTSWDTTAATMARLIDERLAQKAARARRHAAATRPASSV